MATEKRENKIRKSYDELLAFRSAAVGYIKSHRDRTALHHVLEKAIKKTQEYFEDYIDAENDLRVDCALIDKGTGKFVLGEDGKSIAIDPKHAKKFQKVMRELGRKKVEWYTTWVKEVPPTLDAGFFAAFIGFVIHESDDKFKSEYESEVEDVTKEDTLIVSPVD